MLGPAIVFTRPGCPKLSYATASACHSNSKCHITCKIRPAFLRQSLFLPKTADEQFYVRESAEYLQAI